MIDGWTELEYRLRREARLLSRAVSCAKREERAWTEGRVEEARGWSRRLRELTVVLVGCETERRWAETRTEREPRGAGEAFPARALPVRCRLLQGRVETLARRLGTLQSALCERVIRLGQTARSFQRPARPACASFLQSGAEGVRRGRAAA